MSAQHTPGPVDGAAATRAALESGSDAFKPEKLSAPQKNALLNLAAGRNSFHDLHGRSAFGGHNATLRALAKFGLVALHYETGATITDTGRLAANRILANRILAKATGSAS